jgi:hypothetical protein
VSRTIVVIGEAKAIGEFGKSLSEFLANADDLRKKPSLSDSETATLESNAREVKNKVTAFRGNLAQFVSKLKDSGQWNQEFETSVESKLVS